jgi:hypothetical protein
LQTVTYINNRVSYIYHHVCSWPSGSKAPLLRVWQWFDSPALNASYFFNNCHN